MSLPEPLPDHSSLTKIRTRYGLEVFRRFFEAIVEQCQEAGLVWGRELYFDGTKVAANAGKESRQTTLCCRGTPRIACSTRKLKQPVDEEEQQQAAAEPTPDADEELAAPITLPTSLLQRNTKRSPSTMQPVMTGLSKREHKIAA